MDTCPHYAGIRAIIRSTPDLQHAGRESFLPVGLASHPREARRPKHATVGVMLIPAPQDRPFRHREATRVVVLNEDAAGDSVLLFEDSDPGLPDRRWWVTPGGGIDPGEDELDAGVRELQEETGLRVERADLIGPLATRRVVHGYTDQILVQRETFYGVRTSRFDVDTSGHTEDEKITLQSWRWWPVDELARTDAWIWPGYLLDLVAGTRQAPERPVDHGDQFDESTVELLPEQMRNILGS